MPNPIESTDFIRLFIRFYSIFWDAQQNGILVRVNLPAFVSRQSLYRRQRLIGVACPAMPHKDDIFVFKRLLYH